MFQYFGLGIRGQIKLISMNLIVIGMPVAAQTNGPSPQITSDYFNNQVLLYSGSLNFRTRISSDF